MWLIINKIWREYCSHMQVGSFYESMLLLMPDNVGETIYDYLSRYFRVTVTKRDKKVRRKF